MESRSNDRSSNIQFFFHSFSSFILFIATVPTIQSFSFAWVSIPTIFLFPIPCYPHSLPVTGVTTPSPTTATTVRPLSHPLTLSLPPCIQSFCVLTQIIYSFTYPPAPISSIHSPVLLLLQLPGHYLPYSYSSRLSLSFFLPAIHPVTSIQLSTSSAYFFLILCCFVRTCTCSAIFLNTSSLFMFLKSYLTLIRPTKQLIR